MKRKILVADKDSSLKEAFRVIFSDDQYEILYAANGKEAQKLAEESRPEIYIVNVNLSKYTGIEVYKKLQKEKCLEGSRFFFLKDENDRTELLGFQAEGVIEKPINFFKVHERIHKEEEVIDLIDVIEEPAEPEQKQESEPAMAKPETDQTPTEPVEMTAPGPEVTETPAAEDPSSEEVVVIAKRSHTEEPKMKQTLDSGGAVPEEKALEEATSLEVEVKAALGSIMQDAATRLVEAMTPAVSKYIEDYTRRVLLDIAERVIREEIDKLLKESTDLPGKQI
jgi:response regulator RpfG family c-di-GMP phosphodiesterase